MVELITKKVRFETITGESDGQRLDNFLLRELKGVPKSHLYRLIRKGEVRINKKRVKPMARLIAGDILRIPPITLPDKTKPVLSKEQSDWIKETVIFDNGDFIVINKPAKMAVHGGSGVNAGVIEAMRLAYEDEKLELVHRLDKPTSGCLMVARKKSVLRALHALLREKKLKKSYIALLHGRWQGAKQRIIDEPLLRAHTSNSNREVKVDSEGKPSKTMFKCLKQFENCCLVQAHLISGRTHQIRVHAKSMGQPIVGDEKYGERRLDNALALSPKRLFLHAKKLHFTLDKPYHFEVEEGQEWLDYLQRI